MIFKTNLFTKTALKILCYVTLLSIFGMVGCDAVKVNHDRPTTFIEAMNPDWTTMHLRAGLEPEVAWLKAIEIISRRYDFEMLDKDALYARSAWKITLITREEKLVKTSYLYRTRVLFRISSDKDKILLKVEARLGTEDRFTQGWDRGILEDIKEDVMTVIGAAR